MQIQFKSIFGFLTLVSLASCGAKEDSTEANTEGNTTSNSTNSQTGSLVASMEMSGQLQLGAALRLAGEDYKIIAVSAEGDRVEGAIDAITGEFAVNLPKDEDKNYVVLLVNDAASGENKIAGVLNSSELAAISPNSDSPETLELGSLELDASADGSAVIDAEASRDSIVEAMGMTDAEAKTFGAYDNAAVAVSNLDIDGDGVIDEKGEFTFGATFTFSSNEDPNRSSTLDAYKNVFLADTVTINKSRFNVGLSVDVKKFSTTPTAVSFTFDSDAKVNDSGSNIVVGAASAAMSVKATVPAATKITKDFTANTTDPDAGFSAHNFQLQVDEIPKGKYVIEAGGKTFTLSNIDVAGYNSVPPVIPFIKFNVDSSEKITGIDYKWMARKADDTGWELASVDLISKFVAKQGGHYSMYVMENGQRVQKRLEWLLSPAAATGSVSFDDGCVLNADKSMPATCGDADSVKLYVTGFSSLEEAKGTTWANWGWNNFTFLDKNGMMVSVN